ncbi:unnamed protein product [Owenia fusiformis]|uniref:tRNA-splicing endonuclease subunit Sen34 n=1 Tax=Owenia fusiformis TaxID=6347 RepID=A0A8J1UWQ2_OWEFU|nr:unnamed protein product [Owenia fusiformis]
MIEIHIKNKKAYIWNSKDACTIREEYRIIGNLVGSHPKAPRQNYQLHLPLQLLPEETTLLVEKGVAILFNDDKPMLPPIEEDVQKFHESRKRSYEAQKELQLENRKMEIQNRKWEIIEGKKAKRMKKLKSENSTMAEDAAIDEAALEAEAEREVESMEITPIPQSSMQVQIFTGTPYVSESNRPLYSNWGFPSTHSELLRYRVFKDLWEQGHFLTAGGKFGGDFLVYPGDVAVFHSFYIVKCLPYKQKMSALDVVAMARLGSNVKKTVVLCSIDDNDQLCYTSLKWTGIS